VLTTAGEALRTNGARLSSAGPASTRGPGSVCPPGTSRATIPPKNAETSTSRSRRKMKRGAGARRSATLCLHRFAFGCAAAELVGQPLACRGEIEADRIDAIALAGGRRSVVEHVALMRPAPCADDFRPAHAVARIADVFEMPLGERLSEARPSGAALELGPAVEQREAAQAAGENAEPLLVEEDATKRRFGAMLEQNVPFLIAEVGDELLELVVRGRRKVEGCRGGRGHWSSLRVALNMGMRC